MVSTRYICPVQANRVHIDEFLKGAGDHLLLDVRSPAEYTHARIPGAISFPLFTDEERRIVGTAYKQESREKAIKIGLDFFGPKMRGMVEEAEKLLSNRTGKNPHSRSPNDHCIYVYCWRGGMRSGAVSWLLGLYGFRVYTLAGGYKAFRHQVLKTFEQPFELKILGGYTGSGKTAILTELEKKGEAVIDLEKIACHKGSAFGNIKMPPQPSQEMFENILAEELWKKTSPKRDGAMSPSTRRPPAPLWLEDESQRIGNLNIPMAFWQTMRHSPLCFLEIPFEERLNYIMEEYGHCDVQRLMDATLRISKRLGGLETKNVLLHLQRGEIKDAFCILLHYYDKRYWKGLHNRENISALLHKIPCENVTPFNAKALLNQYQNL